MYFLIVKMHNNGQSIVHKINNSRMCSHCNTLLAIEEGVTFYDRNWYHNNCWLTIEKLKEDYHD